MKRLDRFCLALGFALSLAAAGCGSPCGAGTTLCGSVCADTQVDPKNCGACGTACNGGQVCVAGQCAVACPSSQIACSGACVAVMSDAANCGGCGMGCTKGQVCSAGKCGLSCVGGTTLCTGKCVDTTSDPANCGGCATPCANGQVCSAGTCGLTCVGGATLCNGKCADTANDPANCGGCAMACTNGQVCSAGKCSLTCAGGSTLCNGKCVNTKNDPMYCGGCNTPCMNGKVCSAGVCGLSCVGGTAMCNGKCVNLQNDPMYCGDCNTACMNGQVCSAGVCGLSCVGGTTLCNNSCVNPQNDPANCGGCNIACVNGQACAIGQCGLACVGGTTLCNGVCTNFAIDPANCSGCGTACVVANATAACASSTCGIGSCNPGFRDCDGIAGNGCEVNTQSDANNCGKCNLVCSVGQVCIAGACIAAFCPPKPFATNNLPATLAGSMGSGSYGGLTFDGSGNLLAVVGSAPQFLYSINMSTDAVTQVVALRAQSVPWTSVATNAASNMVYLGSGNGGDIDQYDVKNNVLSNIGNVGGSSVNQMVFSSASFAAFPNMIIAATFSGGVVAFDVVKKTKAVVIPSGTIGNASGIAITSTGTLFAISYSQNVLYKVTPAGVISTVGALPGSCDGAAVDEARGRVYVANSGLGKLSWVDMNTGVVTDIAAAAFDGGYWPSPIAYDCNKTVLVSHNPGGPSKVSAIAAP